MKKIFLIFGVLISLNFMAFALTQDDLVPALESTGGIMFDYVQDETPNINVDDSMKKADKINSALNNEEAESRKVPKIKIDAKAIQHQRALDYSTNRSNTMQLPTGF